MHEFDTIPEKEKPFFGKKVYYCGSIKGSKEPDPQFPWQLVQYMVSEGADVLSEHVAARNFEEMLQVRARKCGMDINILRSILQSERGSVFISQKDFEWVHQSTHVVALVNAASHGVGMEIQETLRKPLLGFNSTPLLCLIREDLYPSLSILLDGQVPGKLDSKSL